MVWESDNQGRQRWCTRLWQGGGLSSPLFDGFDNLYVGQPGAMLSFPPTQWIRWRKPVIGLPMTPRFLSPGQLLVVTHLGQVLVFDAHRGDVVGTSLDLVAGVDPTDSQRGLADCAAGPTALPGRRGARVLARRRASSWSGCGSPTPRHPSSSACATGPVRRRCWRGSGPAPPSAAAHSPARCCPPTARPSTSTAATNGCGRSTPPTARPKWSVPLDFQPQTPPSVSPDGLIVAGGGPGREAGRASRTTATTATWCGPATTSTPLVDVESRGHERRLHRRRATARTGMSLLVFDPADGHTAQHLSAAGRHRIPGRGVDRPRPPRGRGHQRRSGVRRSRRLTRRVDTSGDHRVDRAPRDGHLEARPPPPAAARPGRRRR